jgi:hypothetical protein
MKVQILELGIENNKFTEDLGLGHVTSDSDFNKYTPDMGLGHLTDFSDTKENN